MPILGLFRNRKYDRAGHALYAAAVGAARDPWWYDRAGVPDTLDGRFDMVGFLVALLVRRLRRAGPPGPDLAQAVFDAMFGDMDGTLRELGVSDLLVGRKVKAMMEAFHGRASAYEAALDTGDAAALRAAIARNVWRRGPDATAAPEPQEGPDAVGPDAVARYGVTQAAALDAVPLERFVAGAATFQPPQSGSAP